MSEEEKSDFDIKMPNVGEYSKEMLLAFEKEVLGIYISGHPMEEYQELWNKLKTNTTNDFVQDEETGSVQVRDQAEVVVGGMIAEKTIKYTKNDQVMAFLNLEDLVGNVEIVVFPKVYERYSSLLTEDAKIFVKGRAALEEDKDGKILCDQIVTFEEAGENPNPFKRRFEGNGYRGGYGSAGSYQSSAKVSSGKAGYSGRNAGGQVGKSQTVPKGLPKGIWIQFADMEAYRASEQLLFDTIADSDGSDNVVIFLKDSKAVKVLPPNRCVKADEGLIARLGAVFGKENVKNR